MCQIKFAEKIKARVIFSIPFFFENGAVYEIMLKNMVEPDRPQTIHHAYVTLAD
jgi:hypothetical protein